jgi:translation initiation factor IF-1
LERFTQHSSQVYSCLQMQTGEVTITLPRKPFRVKLENRRREIEHALDKWLARVRVRMLEDPLLVSQVAEWEAGAEGGLVCPI